MGGHAVAFVDGEAVAGMTAVVEDKQAVPGGFGQDGGGGNGRHKSVAANDALLAQLSGKGPQARLGNNLVAVDARTFGGNRQPLHRAAHREEGGLQDVDAVDFGRTRFGD